MLTEHKGLLARKAQVDLKEHRVTQEQPARQEPKGRRVSLDLKARQAL